MMSPIDRRSFLKTSGAALAAASVATPGLADEKDRKAEKDGPKSPWKKAFMLGGKTKGPILPTFELLKEAGFEGVELIAPNQLDLDEVLKARDQTGIVIHGVSGAKHWGFPLSSPDPKVVEEGLAAVRQSMKDCKDYGGTTTLLVPAVVTKDVSHREAYERSQANIRKLIPDAEKHGVKIAIEEVWNKFLLSAPEFVRFVDSFESPWVGAYFDVGNVVEYGYPQEWIRELGKRILKVHIKEYAKAKRFGYPLGEGEIDWPAVRQALHDIGYQGWVSAEVGYKDDLAAMKDVAERMDKILGMG